MCLSAFALRLWGFVFRFFLILHVKWNAGRTNPAESRPIAMGVDMEDLPDQMSLTALANRCMSEIENYRRKESYNDQYCLEIFHRALLQHDDDAWKLLVDRFGPM